MAKSPHTPEFRAQVSQEYIDGLGSYDYLAAKYNIGSKTLKQWVAKNMPINIMKAVKQQ